MNFALVSCTHKVKMASQTENFDVSCECCRKSFLETTLLNRHIGKSKSCQSFYGPRFQEMKNAHRRKRVNKHRYKSLEEHDKQLKRRRDLYANNSDLKEKNRKIYQQNKMKIKENNQKERTDTLS